MRNRALLIFAVLALWAALPFGVAFAEGQMAVLKLETEGKVSGQVVDQVTNAIKGEIRQSPYTLSPKGGDVTITDVQLVADCDELSEECLNTACDFLSVQHIIYGTVSADGTAKLTWYSKGKGIQRESHASVADVDAMSRLARRLLVGEQGVLIVESNEIGAELLLNGSPVGFTPYQAETPLGTYSLQLRKKGFESSELRSVVINTGDTVTVSFELVPSAVDSGPMSTMSLVGWILTGTGGAALVGAVVTSVLMIQKEDELAKAVKEMDGKTNPFDLADQGRTLALVSNILYGVGGTLALTGLTLVIIGALDGGDVNPEQAGVPTFNVLAGPDGAAATLQWRF